ncbi:hypothetical protein D3C76_1692130 [compost metagenome]
MLGDGIGQVGVGLVGLAQVELLGIQHLQQVDQDRPQAGCQQHGIGEPQGAPRSQVTLSRFRTCSSHPPHSSLPVLGTP